MKKRLNTETWWFYLAIFVLCFILAGAIHHLMKEPSRVVKEPQANEEWIEALRARLGDRVDETMIEKLRQGQLNESDLDKIEKAYGGEVNEEDKRRLKGVFDRLKKEGRPREQP